MSLTATPGQETAAPVRRPGTQSHLGTLSTCALRHASDDRLVALSRAGSERAFAEIMRRYQRPLQFYCLHLVGPARAEDVVQQAFLQAFVSLRDGARREIALRPWLYRIARNCSIDLLRKQPFDHDELDPDFDGTPQTPGVFEQKEELARIVAAIQALPEGQRRALTLRELEGRSYGEISAELGHTDSGVRQLIFRARTALRNLGALLLPLDSVRWRLLGSSPAVADPNQLAAATSVSSTGGGNVLQAAASAVAATVTLLSAGGPANRQGEHSPPPVTSQVSGPPAPALTPVPGAASAPVFERGRGQNARKVLVRSGGAPAPRLTAEIAPVPVVAPAPLAPVAPVPVATVAPPSVPVAPEPSSVPGPSAAGAAPAGTTDTASTGTVTTPDRPAAKGGAPSTAGSADRPPVAAKPAPPPVKTAPAAPPKAEKKAEKPAKPALPIQPKPVTPPKVVLPKPAPRKPAPPRPPAVPQKPSAPAA